jgi:hypothetical protein
LSNAEDWDVFASRVKTLLAEPGGGDLLWSIIATHDKAVQEGFVNEELGRVLTEQFWPACIAGLNRRNAWTPALLKLYFDALPLLPTNTPRADIEGMWRQNVTDVVGLLSDEAKALSDKGDDLEFFARIAELFAASALEGLPTFRIDVMNVISEAYSAMQSDAHVSYDYDDDTWDELEETASGFSLLSDGCNRLAKLPGLADDISAMMREAGEHFNERSAEASPPDSDAPAKRDPYEPTDDPLDCDLRDVFDDL